MLCRSFILPRLALGSRDKVMSLKNGFPLCRVWSSYSPKTPLQRYALRDINVQVCLAVRDPELEALTDPSQKSWWRTMSGLYLPVGQRILTAKLLWAQIHGVVNQTSMYKMTQRDQDFDAWYHLALLHYWMLLVRLRKEPSSSQLTEELYTQFWNRAEQKMLDQRRQYQNPMTYSKDLKIYNNMYLGSLFAYDEGLLKGDWVFAEALWRNFYNMTFPPGTTLASLVRYVRSELEKLHMLPGAFVLAGVTPWRSKDPLLDCSVIYRTVRMKDEELKQFSKPTANIEVTTFFRDPEVFH